MRNSSANNLIFAAGKGTQLSVRLFCSLCLSVILSVYVFTVSVYMSTMSIYMLSMLESRIVKGRHASKDGQLIQFL